MVRARLLALMALPLLAACGSADPGEVLDTVRATEQSQLEAMAARDLRGATRNYEADAVLIVPGGTPLRGSAAIEQRYAALLGDANFRIAMQPGEAWAAESGELAMTTASGTVTTTDAASGQPVTVPVANQTVWRRADGVGWKIVSEQNAALPAQPTAG